MLIWADEKYNTQKNPCFFATQNNPCAFHIPPKIQKFQTQKNPSNPSPNSPPPSVKCASEAPGKIVCHLVFTYKF